MALLVVSNLIPGSIIKSLILLPLLVIFLVSIMQQLDPAACYTDKSPGIVGLGIRILHHDL
jgi:hypothetical protein